MTEEEMLDGITDTMDMGLDGFQCEGFWEVGHLLPPPFGPSQILLVSFPWQYLVLYQDLLL